MAVTKHTKKHSGTSTTKVSQREHVADLMLEISRPPMVTTEGGKVKHRTSDAPFWTKIDSYLEHPMESTIFYPFEHTRTAALNRENVPLEWYSKKIKPNVKNT